jgi:trehalose 6-phosphate synthase
MPRLVVISNRTPSQDGPAAGGMTVALVNALENRGGLWFGWSGEISKRRSPEARLTDLDGYCVASIDLLKSDHEAYYENYSNRVLWPTFHYRVDLAKHDSNDYGGYNSVNEYFADRVVPLLRSDDIIWVHDYHLIPLADKLRSRGVKSAIGFFLHIPLPAPELLTTIPEHEELISALFAYDLVGFQTRRDLRAFSNYVTYEMGGMVSLSGTAQVSGRRVKAAVFPIGTDPEGFASMAASGLSPTARTQLRQHYGPGQMIIGVDRLDYSKGLIKRFRAFEALLDAHPEIHNSISFLQIASPSRSRVPEYQALRTELDAICGRINGRFSDHGWVPLRYVNRAYPQQHLAELYRFARVGLVTPLCDGMNLVAKEFVASQDPADPGVLVLSRYAGAADELSDALIVNPHDVCQVSKTVFQALSMPRRERCDRWVRLMNSLRDNTIDDWRENFIGTLQRSQQPSAQEREFEGSMERLIGSGGSV